MVVEARHVGDRIAFDGARRTRGSGRTHRLAKVARHGQHAHSGVVIEVAEGVDGRHVETGPGRRFGNGPRRDAGDQHASRTGRLGSVTSRHQGTVAHDT
jgi:hypothetical protein